MSYNKQTWVDGVTLVDANKMNHIEQGIYDSATKEEPMFKGVLRHEGLTTTNKQIANAVSTTVYLGNPQVSTQLESSENSIFVNELGRDVSNTITSSVVNIEYCKAIRIGKFVMFSVAFYKKDNSKISGDAQNLIQFGLKPNTTCRTNGSARNVGSGTAMQICEANINTDGNFGIYVPEASQYFKVNGLYTVS